MFDYNAITKPFFGPEVLGGDGSPENPYRFDRIIKSNTFWVTKFPFEVKKVIFNNPATIVIWTDGVKTVVKCQKGDTFDREKGIALCFMKRAMGNKGDFNNILKQWG